MARCIVLRLAKLTTCLGIGLLLLIAALHSGCKRSTAVVDSEDAKGAAPKGGDADEFAFKGLNGEVVHFAGGKPVALPADFPADVAVYAGATVVMTVTGKNEMSITLSTADSPEKVLAFYKAHFKDNGWKTTADSPQLLLLKGEKEDRKLIVLVSERPKETSVQLVVSHKNNSATERIP
jgi:hypothetical protein